MENNQIDERAKLVADLADAELQLNEAAISRTLPTNDMGRRTESDPDAFDEAFYGHA
jgi:arginine repressor